MPRPTTPTLTPYTEQLPDINNPATWAARTPLFWNWVTGPGYQNMVDAVDYADDAAAYIEAALAGSQTVVDSVTQLQASAQFSTYSGGPNTITLTTGKGLTSIPNRAKFRFRATSANTGAVTINVDGTGPGATTTIVGSALPSGFIRTNVDTVIERIGTSWVVRREPEKISNANGIARRYEDGLMIAQHILDLAGGITTAYGSLFISANTTWTFPATFASIPVPYAFPRKNMARVWSANGNIVNTAQADFFFLKPLSDSSAEQNFYTQAIGEWY